VTDLNQILESTPVEYTPRKLNKVSLLKCIICGSSIEIFSSEKVSHCVGFKQIVSDRVWKFGKIVDVISNVPRFQSGRACRDCITKFRHAKIGDKMVITVLADEFNSRD
jgi:hypothetical protein